LFTWPKLRTFPTTKLILWNMLVYYILPQIMLCCRSNLIGHSPFSWWIRITTHAWCWWAGATKMTDLEKLEDQVCHKLSQTNVFMVLIVVVIHTANWIYVLRKLSQAQLHLLIHLRNYMMLKLLFLVPELIWRSKLLQQ
jgi:hypothetical protein